MTTSTCSLSPTSPCAPPVTACPAGAAPLSSTTTRRPWRWLRARLPTVLAVLSLLSRLVVPVLETRHHEVQAPTTARAPAPSDRACEVSPGER